MPRRRRDPSRCQHGHDIGPDSGNREVTPSGKVECRECHKLRQRSYKARKRCRPPTEREVADRARSREAEERAMRGAELEDYFARMRAEEILPAWEKRKRMWPDDEGLRQR